MVSPVEVSWCPRVSQGLMTGQREPTAPTEGMPSPTQAKFTQPPELPSLAVGTGSSVFGSSGGERFLKCSYCGSVFGAPTTKTEFGVESVRKVGIRSATPV